MSLLRNFATVGGATATSRILGFVRDIFVAAALGTGPVADAFFVAFRFPTCSAASLPKAPSIQPSCRSMRGPLKAKVKRRPGNSARKRCPSSSPRCSSSPSIAEIAMPIWLMYRDGAGLRFRSGEVRPHGVPYPGRFPLSWPRLAHRASSRGVLNCAAVLPPPPSPPAPQCGADRSADVRLLDGRDGAPAPARCFPSATVIGGVAPAPAGDV